MKQLERMPYGSDPATVAAIVERDGGLVLTGALTADQVESINEGLDNVGLRPSSDLLDGIFDQSEWGGRTHRLVHALKYSKTLREAFYDSEILTSYLAATLPGPEGHYLMAASHVTEIQPGEIEQELHRDADLFMRTLGICNASSVNVAVNFLLALTEVTEEMGAPRVIPGSGNWSDYEVPGAQDQTVPATMSPGDALIINGKVLHGGGANKTARPRRVLLTGFTPGFMLGEEAWPFAISVEEAQSYPPRVQKYLGFWSISNRGEEPGFMWRVNGKPLEKHLGLA